MSGGLLQNQALLLPPLVPGSSSSSTSSSALYPPALQVQQQQQQQLVNDIIQTETPTRFLQEFVNFKFTPGLLTKYCASSFNPFELSFKEKIEPTLPVPASVSAADGSASSLPEASQNEFVAGTDSLQGLDQMLWDSAMAGGGGPTGDAIVTVSTSLPTPQSSASPIVDRSIAAQRQAIPTIAVGDSSLAFADPFNTANFDALVAADRRMLEVVQAPLPSTFGLSLPERAARRLSFSGAAVPLPAHAGKPRRMSFSGAAVPLYDQQRRLLRYSPVVLPSNLLEQQQMEQQLMPEDVLSLTLPPLGSIMQRPLLVSQYMAQPPQLPQQALHLQQQQQQQKQVAYVQIEQQRRLSLQQLPPEPLPSPFPSAMDAAFDMPVLPFEADDITQPFAPSATPTMVEPSPLLPLPPPAPTSQVSTETKKPAKARSPTSAKTSRSEAAPAAEGDVTSSNTPRKPAPKKRKRAPPAGGTGSADRGDGTDTASAAVAPSSTTPPGEEGLDDEEKRRRFLERNRLAASKCRMKKKQWLQDLETKSAEIGESNRQLQIIVAQLREEILELKGQLLLHRDCTCDVVQKYVETSPTFNPSIKSLEQEQQHLHPLALQPSFDCATRQPSPVRP